MQFPQALVKTPLHWLQNTLHVWPGRYCLISGPPRSGTTALESWLSEQPGVAGFGEVRMLIAANQIVEQVNQFRPLHAQSDLLLKQIRRMIHAFYSRQRILLGKRLVFEKAPLEPIGFPDLDYPSFLKNVRILFPDIRFLFLHRNPVPTINSMKNRVWGGSRIGATPTSFTIEEHIEHWNRAISAIHAYRDDPHSYFCAFEHLVAEPEQESESIARFLGIRHRTPFVPKTTQAMTLNPSNFDKIMQATQTHRSLLDAG